MSLGIEVYSNTSLVSEIEKFWSLSTFSGLFTCYLKAQIAQLKFKFLSYEFFLEEQKTDFLLIKLEVSTFSSYVFKGALT